MVAFGAADKSMREAMLNSKAHQDATKVFPQLNTASSVAEFTAGLGAIEDIQSSRMKGEALSVLAERFAAAPAALPNGEALSFRAALVEQLKSMPVKPGSADALAPGVLGALDSIRSMTHKAFAPDHAALLEMAPADRARALLELGSTLEAASPDSLALNEVISKHGMAARREFMTQLIDRSFDANATPQMVQFATIVVPVRLAALEPGSVSKDHVTELLSRLAQHAIGPSGVSTIGDPEWGEFASAKMRTALEKHGIDPAAHPQLSSALGTLASLR